MRRMVAAATALLAAIALSVTPVLAQDSSGESAPGDDVRHRHRDVRRPYAATDDDRVRLQHARLYDDVPRRDERSARQRGRGRTHSARSATRWISASSGAPTSSIHQKVAGDCSWAGSNYPVGEPDAMGDWPILLAAVCPGTGGYEGLSYVFQHSDTNFLERSSFNGVIYEGAPPPLEMRAPAE